MELLRSYVSGLNIFVQDNELVLKNIELNTFTIPYNKEETIELIKDIMETLNINIGDLK